MQTTNPYTTPQGELLEGSEEYGTIKILSASGRIGRLRYIGYSMGIGFLIYLVMGLGIAVGAAVFEDNTATSMLPLIMGVGMFFMLMINVLLTVQRCHDFNASGWLSLLLLIPLAPFIFWFVPGTQGANNYGLQPPPNRGAAVIIVLVLVAVMILGILAAIAIPAYQDYLMRAQGM
jgi:uncharacterized membrane protein YhaH (DUF805 family)